VDAFGQRPASDRDRRHAGAVAGENMDQAWRKRTNGGLTASGLGRRAPAVERIAPTQILFDLKLQGATVEELRELGIAGAENAAAERIDLRHGVERLAQPRVVVKHEATTDFCQKVDDLGGLQLERRPELAPRPDQGVKV